MQDVTDADAVVLSACVQMPSLPAVPVVEKELGLPVLTAATSTVHQVLTRLGLSTGDHLVIPLPAAEFLPAAGQGALAIETRENDPAVEVALLLEHAPTRAAVTAERVAIQTGFSDAGRFVGQVPAALAISADGKSRATVPT